MSSTVQFGLYSDLCLNGYTEGMLRLIQGILDPLQQTLADGCHLCWDTGSYISEAGFSRVELNTAYLKKSAFINPQIYGVAYK